VTTPTNIEKKSLEAHVEICAVRYGALDTKLNNREQRMDKMEMYLINIKDSLETKLENRSTNVMGWTVTILGVLLSALLGYLGHEFLK